VKMLSLILNSIKRIRSDLISTISKRK